MQMTELFNCLVIIIGVIAVIGGVSIVAATVGILYCRGHRRGMHNYIALFFT